jgi:lipoprotein-anchoring transpeptidase ErfK/SrfK
LKEAFSEKKSEVHIPAYEHEGVVHGKNDIGNTYIEVDMGNQKLYAYLDGQLLVETDIVTGNVKKKMSTPEGVVYVNKKQRNRTLRGPGYASFVKYWMPVKGGIGLHDASWRKEFGGEIYKTNGSHGCINIPRNVMSEIYENFEVGTPVIMFY